MNAETIEAVARRMFEAGSPPITWEQAGLPRKNQLRALAGVAIEAYLGRLRELARKPEGRLLPRFSEGRRGGIGDPFGPAEVQVHIHNVSKDAEALDAAVGAFKPVLQEWVMLLPLMQQTVLLTCIRGPDGLPKYNPAKMLLRWYRRCTLLSAMDGKVLKDPYDTNGGSFTGPSLEAAVEWEVSNWEAGMNQVVSNYLRELDATPLHFHTHFMHGAQIIGYKHPDIKISEWWVEVYLRFVNQLHLHPESATEMDQRLSDNREEWLKRNDPATTK